MMSPDQYEILVVEDNPTQRSALEQILTEAGYNVKTTNSVEKALNFVQDGIDCVVAGVVSGEISRLDIVKHWKNHFPDTPLPVINESQSVMSLLEMVSTTGLGNEDGIETIAEAKRLLQNLMRLVHACQQDQKIKDIAFTGDGTSDGLIGASPIMKSVMQRIYRSSAAQSTVLVTGESGTGKDLAARAIHRNSARKNGPFIAINCAAMPEALVESELFGYDRGAFTGALNKRTGRFEAAHGGTLFVDEIGDCALPVQAKLLRILENRIVTPLGGQREVKVDTRVIVATSRDLPAMINSGQFREDLFYRLNIINIIMPPLRERAEDIPLLTATFIHRINQQNNSAVDSISADALDALQHYPWPGNIRQLLNVIEQIIVLADRDKTVISLGDLPEDFHTASHCASGPAHGITPGSDPKLLQSDAPPRHDRRATDVDGPLLTLDQLEKRTIEKAMSRFGNNKTKAAQAIGISVRTLQRKLNQSAPPSLVLLRTESTA
ncbi:MAG: sigma 54-interacting transcriptional regulator [Phycisphaerae bacterium]